MLHSSTIWHSLLEGLLSLSARVDRQATGSWYQAWLLRRMGVQVKGPVAIAAGGSFLGAQNLELGRYVTIGAGSRIVAWDRVTIGDDFMASDLLNLNSGFHDPLTLEPGVAPIAIGDRVWCGTRVTICAGVEIGDDVVIGAGSVVTKSLPSNCVAYGVPARAMRPLERMEPCVWSMWPERRAGGHLANAPAWKQHLHWLRARI
ncbi:MAG TPA: acyltransferase [Chthoniobacter sp.]|jgi:acetyltransferase-like isoleucine patch superfamily enzyme